MVKIMVSNRTYFIFNKIIDFHSNFIIFYDFIFLIEIIYNKSINITYYLVEKINISNIFEI
jgi:hypothetical protein